MHEWKPWVERHALLFGLTSEADVVMVREWANLFDGAGYTPAELLAATETLALTDPPKYRSDHLNALMGAVRAARAKLAAAPPPSDAPDWTRCQLCEDTGRVIVPNRTLLKQNRRGTEAVLCRCRLGDWFRQSMLDKRPPLLDDYEREVPDWEEIAKQHKRQEKSENEALGKASGMDRTFGPIVARIQKRLAAREAGGPGGGGRP